MQPTTMMKDHKAFDDFLNGISFADFGVEYVERAHSDPQAMDLYESDNDAVFEEEDTARIVFGGPIKVVEPVVSPNTVDSPMRLPRRKDLKPTTRKDLKPTDLKPMHRREIKPTHRKDIKPTARLNAKAHHYRDRRRSKIQRERENIKRKIKQAYFLKRRSDCFSDEFLLRDAICNIISSVMRDRHVGVQQAITLLPADVRRVIASATAAMTCYRKFTGQKHICEQLNGFPAWSADNN